MNYPAKYNKYKSESKKKGKNKSFPFFSID